MPASGIEATLRGDRLSSHSNFEAAFFQVDSCGLPAKGAGALASIFFMKEIFDEDTGMDCRFGVSTARSF